ncbi:MAG TPA: winged helix-turn-helix transcriptional regulator [archaeon]|nr:winged helix-turn-helix transcriptional regulator [archaeon]
MEEIVVRRFRPPLQPDQDMEWFCRSLGLLGNRDKNKTGMKIFVMLVEASKENRAVDADNIAKKVKITRTAVLHHVKAMESEGLVDRRNGDFGLRAHNFQSLVDEIEKDMLRAFDSIREIAEDMDSRMNMPVRKKD